MRQLYLLLTAAVVLFASCGKATVESETKRWASTQQTLDKLSGEYPGFKAALQEAKAAGEAKMKAAESVSKEEEKVKAMSDAINAARPQFVKDLEDLKTNTNKLKDLMTQAPKKVTTPADKDAAMLAVREADFTLGSVETKLRSAAPANINEANGITAGIASELKAATDRLDKILKDAEKTTAGNKTAADSTKKADEKKLADVKCRSCGTMNAAGSKKCSSCTAPID